MERWKKRVADVTAHARSIKERGASIERKLKEDVALARREAPVVAVYRETFLHRRRTLAARVDGAAAKARDDGFRRVCRRIELPSSGNQTHSARSRIRCRSMG